MVFGFGKSDEEDTQDRSSSRSPSRSPTNQVRELASQGYSEREIIEKLKDLGYSSQEINKSINKVLKSKVSNSDGQAAASRRPPQTTQSRSSQEQGPVSSSNNFIAPEPSQPNDSFEGGSADESDPFAKFQGNNKKRDDVWEMTEEEEIELEILIEEIIDEKWVTVESDLEKFREEREGIIRRIESLEEKVEKLEEKHEEERERLEDKTDKTFDHVKSVESRVGSVEKAFKDFLPQLTENVRSLSSVVKDLEEDTARSNRSSSLRNNRMPDSPESYIEGSKQEENSKEEEDESPSAIPQ
ncbi:MAG: hypothetical protein ACLFQ8_01340 [Candidatus Aenigmatarchaeota archaeon]